MWLILAFTSLPVAAHKLQVFAFAEGDHIEGTAYFAGGAKASGAQILIQDAVGTTLAELTPDADGRFRYQAQMPTDLLIIAESGDGHRAQWRITADELAGGFPSSTPLAPTVDTRPLDGRPSGMIASSIDPALIAAIDQAVARQVRPLREQLIAAQDEIRLRDILGGLGYIFGLTGLALWWRNRHTRP